MKFFLITFNLNMKKQCSSRPGSHQFFIFHPVTYCETIEKWMNQSGWWCSHRHPMCHHHYPYRLLYCLAPLFNQPKIYNRDELSDNTSPLSWFQRRKTLFCRESGQKIQIAQRAFSFLHCHQIFWEKHFILFGSLALCVARK